MTSRLPNPVEALDAITDLVVEALTEVLNRFFIQAPPGFLYAFVQANLPKIAEFKVPTPLGSVVAPEIGLPELGLLALDERKREALKATIAIDLSMIVALIPGVGDVVSDIVEDTYGAKLREILTTSELASYSKFDKLGPATIAIARVFMLDSLNVGRR